MKSIIGLFIVFMSTGFCAQAQSGFDKKIIEAVKGLDCVPPTSQEPVTLNASLLIDRDSIAVIVKVLMAPGWHIYKYVPSNMPYIQIENVLKLPNGLKAAGKWMSSKPFPSPTDRGVLIYEKEAWFVQKAIRASGESGEGMIQTGLYYQSCDLRQCLQPVEKTLDLKISSFK